MFRFWLKRFFLVLCALCGAAALAQESRSPAPERVLVIEMEGVIGPASAHFMARAVEEAESRGAGALLVQLDTPGGLSESMRDIIQSILGSPTPVIVHVSPSGARAASAGTYILYASHVAAMAPGTNLGAATPVQVSGGFPGAPQEGDEGSDAPGDGDADGSPPPAGGDASRQKAVNDAIAYIRSLAEMRGRNVEWAERAVREAASLPASEALELGVIDLVAADLDDVLAAADGRTVETTAGEQTLRTNGAVTERLEPGAITQALAILANPNVALILMLIGVYGIILEFYTPGSIGPGVIGAICLILGLYALNQLPISYAGALLMILGLAFMVAEGFSPSFGILGLGGLAGFAIGAALLIDTDYAQFRVSLWVIAAIATFTGAFFFWVIASLVSSRSKPLASGRENMPGQAASVLDWEGGAGHVLFQGERWRASGNTAFEPGEEVVVVDVNDLRLTVAPAGSPTRTPS